MERGRKVILLVTLAMTGGAILVVLTVMRLRVSQLPDEHNHPKRGVTRQLNQNRWIVSHIEKEAYLRDLQAVTKQITLKPNPGKDENSVTHLAIFKIAEESPMYAAGFRMDDRILKLNGAPIGTMSRAVNLIHEIKACSKLTVQVQRGDQIIDYQFDFE